MTARIDVKVDHDAWRGAVADVEAICARAAGATLEHMDGVPPDAEVSMLLCDDDTVSDLNSRYRGRAGPTNVLSFPNGHPGAGALLGDVAIAYETVSAEAKASRLAIVDHLTHLVVHGVLHLLGFDHQTTPEAEEMEAIEIEILERLGVADPYAEEHAPPA